MAYLYSSCFASMILEDNSKIVERLDFSDIIAANSKLEAGLWLPEEEQLIAKHHPEAFIGFKKEAKQGIKTTQALDKLAIALAAMRAESKELFKSNMIITKDSLKKSVGNDLLIIHCVGSIEAINKTINTLAKRLREWYGLYNPEWSDSVAEHQAFVDSILASPKEKLLKELGLSPASTMGADLGEEDVAPFMELAAEIKDLYLLKEGEELYLEAKMKALCPNIAAVAGDLIGAKLIAYAGSLKRLAELPSSTIQLLGAEKALFRHITRKSLPPKYGVLHEHPLITRTRKQDHGKVARLLADKISLAARVDYFHGQFIGDKLKEDIEKRLPR